MSDIISKNDINKLIDKPNDLLSSSHDRIALYEMPKPVLSFYENNKDKINGDVVIVLKDDDIPIAAQYRNSGKKVFFVFSDTLLISSYFTGVCHEVVFNRSLIKRINNNKEW